MPILGWGGGEGGMEKSILFHDRQLGVIKNHHRHRVVFGVGGGTSLALEKKHPR